MPEKNNLTIVSSILFPGIYSKEDSGRILYAVHSISEWHNKEKNMVRRYDAKQAEKKCMDCGLKTSNLHYCSGCTGSFCSECIKNHEGDDDDK